MIHLVLIAGTGASGWGTNRGRPTIYESPPARGVRRRRCEQPTLQEVLPIVRPAETPERAAQLEHLLERLRDPSVTLPEAAGLRSRLLSLLHETERGASTPVVSPESDMARWDESPDEPARPLPEPLRSRLGSRSWDVLVARRGGGVVLSGRCPSFHAKQIIQHEVTEFFGLPVLSNRIDVRDPS